MKERPKNAFDRYAEAMKKEETIIRRTFALKAVTGVLAVFATQRYTAVSVSIEREHVEWRAA